jgi:hypothetical protein
MKLHSKNSGLTLIEASVTAVLIGVLGLIIFSLLNVGTILGAKNIAVNTAHQQARVAMLQMINDLHSSVSLPALSDEKGDPLPPLQDPAFPSDPTKTIPDPGPAAGIAFQLMTVGPLKVAANAAAGQDKVQVTVPAASQKPENKQRLIVRSHGIEADISQVSRSGTTYTLTLEKNGATYNLPVAISLTNTNPAVNGGLPLNVACFITNRCSYTVRNGALEWNGQTAKKAFSVMGNGITNKTPFSTPKTPAGSPYYRFVAAIDLSTSDTKYDKRGFKAANILLNGLVPIRARLTDAQ